MSDLEIIKGKFAGLKVCVIIPTYNNAGTLAAIIADVARYTEQIIVVNDGSTDATEQIVRSFPFVQFISYPKNVGKGWALRRGFEHAVLLGYDYAISIDSDGQHFAKDIPAFIDKLENVRDAIIVGSRNMDQASIPGKSSFGHKFSNFWFKVETDIDCPDTQSGFRLYPIQLLKNIKFITLKYEFEIEVLVRAAWKDISIDSVPVSVHYEPKETRVSHFRPFQDFSRVSILNTFLVVIAFAYIKPRDFFRTLLNKNKNKSRQALLEQLFNLHNSDQVKAASVGVGVFSGILPIWGFQIFAALFLAFAFRLNRALAIIASNISIPPMIPLIVFLSYKTGGFWMGNKTTPMAFSTHISLKSIGQHLEQYIYGSITLAVIAGLLAALLTFILLKLFKRKAVSAF
jgi:glycosyltransferase involved in cell wall biosynthesis